MREEQRPGSLAQWDLEGSGVYLCLQRALSPPPPHALTQGEGGGWGNPFAGVCLQVKEEVPCISTCKISLFRHMKTLLHFPGYFTYSSSLTGQFYKVRSREGHAGLCAPISCLVAGGQWPKAWEAVSSLCPPGPGARRSISMMEAASLSPPRSRPGESQLRAPAPGIGNRRPSSRAQRSGTTQSQGQLGHHTACITRGRGRAGAESERSPFGSTFFFFQKYFEGNSPVLSTPSNAPLQFFSFRSRKGQQTFP